MNPDKAIDIYQKLDTLRLSMWLDLSAHGDKCLANPKNKEMESEHHLLESKYYCLEAICTEFSESLFSKKQLLNKASLQSEIECLHDMDIFKDLKNSILFNGEKK